MTETSSAHKPSPNDVEHRPRTRASGPGIKAKDLQEWAPPPMASPPSASSEISPTEHMREKRHGLKVIEYGCYLGAGAVVYTYLSGFLYLFQKNRAGWEHTFRQRTIVLAPVLALYATGTGVVPMPFKHNLEVLLGRRAISQLDHIDMNKKAADKIG